MKRVEGSAGVSLLECTNPVKNKWRIRWGVERYARLAVIREPVQLQSRIRSCRPNGRAEPAGDVQAGCG